MIRSREDGRGSRHEVYGTPTKPSIAPQTGTTTISVQREGKPTPFVGLGHARHYGRAPSRLGGHRRSSAEAAGGHQGRHPGDGAAISECQTRSFNSAPVECATIEGCSELDDYSCRDSGEGAGDGAGAGLRGSRLSRSMR